VQPHKTTHPSKAFSKPSISFSKHRILELSCFPVSY
jgi:hypothetical protein